MQSELSSAIEALRATRDAHTCLAGLNAFRRALAQPSGGPEFLMAYLQRLPEWQELQAVWDAQLTMQHYHVTVTLLLLLADVLNACSSVAAAAAAGPTPPQQHAPAEEGEAGQQQQQLSGEQARRLATAGAELAQSVLQRRMKAIYFCLSSEQRGKANAALTLLEALASSGAPEGARELLRVFDWQLKALEALARPFREKKAESGADAALSAAERQQRQWQKWRAPDPLARPTRAALSGFALALLRQAGGNQLLLQQLLGVRPLLGGVLRHLSGDPPEQQLRVLQLLQRRVLSRRGALPPPTQAALFTEGVLEQLAQLAEAAEEEEESEAEAAAAAAAGEQSEVAAAAAARAAEAVLLALVTDDAHGLCCGSSSASTSSRFVLAEAGSHTLLPGQRRVLRLLLRLHPADSAAHLRVLTAAVGADAAVGAATLLSLTWQLEPSAVGGRWFTYAATLGRMLQLLAAAAPPGLTILAARGAHPPHPGSRQQQALLRCCLPPCLQRAALSRGLQHSSALVRYATVCLLCHIMGALASILQDCQAAAEAAARAAPPSIKQRAAARQRWLECGAQLRQGVRQQLPDPQLLMALLAGADKEQGKLQGNELLLTATLQLLLLWQRLLPGSLLEAHVDPKRLLPQQPLALRPQHQLLLLELLLAASDAADQAAEAVAAAGEGAVADEGGPAAVAAAPSAQQLLPALRLLSGGGQTQVQRVAFQWLHRRLAATGVFGGNAEEVELWLLLLPKGSDAACSFLAEALQLLLRRPQEMWEQQAQLLSEHYSQGAASDTAASSDAAAQQQQQQRWSLLAPCALRQLLRVLPSPKMAAGDKAALAVYTAGVLQQLLQQQAGPGAAAAYAAALLGVLRQEAARVAQAGSQSQPAAAAAEAQQSNGRKRKESSEGVAASSPQQALLVGPEGQPLLGLVAALELEVQLHAEQQPQKKQKRKNGAANGSSGSTPLLQVQASGDAAAQTPAEYALGAPTCLLLAELAGAEPDGALSSLGGKESELLAAVQQQVQGGAPLGSAPALARQCLFWLQHATTPHLGLQLCGALRSAVLGGSGRQREQAECLRLLASSPLVLAALHGAPASASAAQQAVALSTVQLLQAVLQAPGSTSLLPACQPLLDAATEGLIAALDAAPTGSSATAPPAVQQLLLLLPHMLAAAAQRAAEALLDSLGCGSEAAAGKEEAAAAAPGWLTDASAQVLAHQLAAGSLEPQHMQRACGAMLALVTSAAQSAAVDECLLQLLSPRHRVAALAALGPAGQEHLLQHCLLAATPGRSKAVASWISSGSACRSDCLQLFGRLLPQALSGSKAGRREQLALLLAPAVACLQRAQQAGAAPEAKSAAAAVVAALRPLLLAFLGAKQQTDQQPSDAGQQGPADTAALLHAHALPCLRMLLAAEPLPAEERATLLQRLLPQQGWAVGEAACSTAALLPNTAEKGEAAVALLGASSASNSPGAQELLPFVCCFASTLASLLKLPHPTAAQVQLEAHLLRLLDGPVGDAVAALPSQQRATPAVAELAAAALTTLATPLLRHRVTAAAAGEGVAAVRVLRRLAAALLPDEASEVDGQQEERPHTAASGSSGGESSSDSDAQGRDSSSEEEESDASMLDSQQQPQEVHNEPVATAAGELLQRLLGHSHFLPAMQAASAAPLPPTAQHTQRPLMGLLQLSEVPAAAEGWEQPARGGLSLGATVQPLGQAGEGEPAGAPAAGMAPAAVPAVVPAAPGELKKEFCELLETLLDLLQQYSRGAASAAAASAAEARERALLPLLMASYGGTCSPADAAVWSLATALNQAAWERTGRQAAAAAAADWEAEGSEAPTAADAAAEDPDAAAVAALLQGPLSTTCFAFGPAAVALQQLPERAADAPEQRRALLRQRLLPGLDPLRCALTVLHWPERACLANGGSSAAEDSAQEGSQGAGGGPPVLPGAPAAYDPCFLIPLACCALRERLLAPRACAESGLLSVCLRGLAAKDAALRAAAYQALAAFSMTLTMAEFREKTQLMVLLGTLRAAVARPFQRLPAVHAALLAEGALLLLHPEAPLYPVLNRHLLKSYALPLQDVPMLRQLLLGGAQAHAAERRWLLQLLLAGLRGPEDAQLYRQRHVFELAMSLWDSPVAEPESALLALRVVCRATFIPRAAKQLAREAGLVPWLASVAAAAAEQLLSPPGAATGPAGRTLQQAALLALAALRRLLGLDTVMRGSGDRASSAAARQQMLAAAEQLVGACACHRRPVGTEGGGEAVALWTAVQGLLTALKQQSGSWAPDEQQRVARLEAVVIVVW